VIRNLPAVITAFALGLVVAPAAAQTHAAPSKASAEQKQSRYQIGVMERVLEGAVEHGVTMTRDRLQAVLSADMQLISENARVRGFRLEGYGLFFDVIVPPFEGTMPWALRTLDQNDLGLGSALKALKAHVNASGDASLEQALRRIELQVSPMMLTSATAGRAAASARNVTGAPTAVDDQQPIADPILNDPNEAYRAEVKQALMDAMLDHSSSLGIADGEWLTVAARRNDDPPRLAPADSEAPTMVIRVRGSDLMAFLARQISREETMKRFDVRVF
jgi:hypothetical protein